MIQEIHAIVRDDQDEELVAIKCAVEIENETLLVNALDLSASLSDAIIRHYYRERQVSVVHLRRPPGRAIPRPMTVRTFFIRLFDLPFSIIRRIHAAH
jgi:hypothetical protein